MSEDYTPTTALVRVRYIDCAQLLDLDIRNADDTFDFTESDTKLRSEFDRWFQPYAEAFAAIQRVRELHKSTNGRVYPCCDICVDLEGNLIAYPCPTIEALDGNHE